MQTTLPPLTYKTQEMRGNATQEDSKRIVLKLPPWDQPAVINWEPTEPPSPYCPVIQKRAYPSVVSNMPRLAKRFGKKGEVSTASKKKLVDANVETPESISNKEMQTSIVRLCKEESEARDIILFDEQRESNRLCVLFLQRTSILLESDINLVEEGTRNTFEREEERQRMCYAVEMDFTARRIRKRMEERMRQKFSQLMPKHKEGRNSIMEKEAKELASIIDWFKKKRPFGMLLPAFLCGDRRRIQPKKPTDRYNKTRNTRGSRKQRYSDPKSIKERNSLDTWPDIFPEPSYLEEGRRAWQHQKMLLYEQRKGLSSTREVELMEEALRADIIAQEAEEWLPIIALGVDDFYEAKQQTLYNEQVRSREEEEKLKELFKREAIYDRLEDEASIKEESALLGELQKREKIMLQMDNDVAIIGETDNVRNLDKYEENFSQKDNETSIKIESNIIRDIENREVKLQQMEIDADIQKEAAVVKELQKREAFFQQIEDETALNKEIVVVEELRQREALFQKLDDEVSIEREANIMKELRKLEDLFLHLENEAQLKREALILEELRKREQLLLQLQNNSSLNNEGEAEIHKSIPLQTKKFNTCEGTDVTQINTNNNNNNNNNSTGRDEASSSCCSDSNASQLHPMLNVVLGIALERDPHAALRHPALSALGEASCNLAASLGGEAGEATRAFAIARHIPLCPAFLLHGLWGIRGEGSSGPATSLKQGETKESKESVNQQQQEELMKEEARTRGQLIRKQIEKIWDLYQKASLEASEVSKTNYGEVYYVGVRMPNDI